MAINHNINADNNIAEIQQTAIEAAAKLQSVEVLERQVFAQEKQETQQQAGQQNQPNDFSGNLFSKAQASGDSLAGRNRFDVASDMAINKATSGMASVELATMGLRALGEGMGIRDHVQTGFEGPPGLRRGKKSKKRKGIKTAHFNDISGRADGIEDFTQSGVKGVKTDKKGALNCKKVKDLVIGQKMACEKTYDAARVAERQAGMKIATAAKMGVGAPVLAASLASGPKGYVDPEVAKRKAEKNNIWSDDGATA